MKKIQFEILSIEVDKLYDQPIDVTDEVAINEQVELIRQLILSAGWDEESYSRHLFGFNKSN